MAASVDPYLVDWLDLVFRWFHVAAAIVWIGTSFYFVALDSHLLPPAGEVDVNRRKLLECARKLVRKHNASLSQS